MLGRDGKSIQAIVFNNDYKFIMNRFIFFDSLRGIAAFIVLIGHYFPETYFKSLPVINLLSDTKLSVCIFFVLSGFVLMQGNKKYEINIYLNEIFNFYNSSNFKWN